MNHVQINIILQLKTHQSLINKGCDMTVRVIFNRKQQV